MSNEIVYNATLTNTGLRTSFATGSKQKDQTTKRKVSNTQAIGTTYEALVMGEVSTARWAYFENKDLANYVEVGIEVAAAFQPFLRLDAGDYVIVPLATNAPFARANTAAVDLLYEIHSS